MSSMSSAHVIQTSSSHIASQLSYSICSHFAFWIFLSSYVSYFIINLSQVISAQHTTNLIFLKFQYHRSARKYEKKCATFSSGKECSLTELLGIVLEILASPTFATIMTIIGWTGPVSDISGLRLSLPSLKIQRI